VSINIHIEAESAAEARLMMAELLSGVSRGRLIAQPDAPLVRNGDGQADQTDDTATETAEAKPQRERGQPAAGRKRRTKEEIAEDEAAAAAEPEEKAAISTGEERVGPEDDAETVAQDEADEKAESDAATAAREPDKKLTLDDVRNALGVYVKKYGMAAVQTDGPKVISLVLKDDKKVKVSDIPDDQKVIQAVLDGVAEMTAKNPFSRDLVA
jgi:hypothetical protein